MLKRDFIEFKAQTKEVLEKAKELEETYENRSYRIALIESILAAGCGDSGDAHFWLDVAFAIKRSDPGHEYRITTEAYDKARAINNDRCVVNYMFTMCELYKASHDRNEASAYFWLDVVLEIIPEDDKERGMGARNVHDAAKELLRTTASLPAIYIALCRAVWCFKSGKVREAHVWIDVFILLCPAGTKDVVRA